MRGLVSYGFLFLDLLVSLGFYHRGCLVFWLGGGTGWGSIVKHLEFGTAVYDVDHLEGA